MPVVIPLTDDSSQTETILGFDLFFYWNIRDNSWRMDISKNGEYVLRGIKLVVGIFLIRYYGLRIGEFIVFEKFYKYQDPTRDGFSSNQFLLVYFDQVEIDELLA